ncbi:MAG TPA: flagellar biosynthesis protein FliQ [Scandinavium sp.]|jgi:flagellar biosynthetic protein FliQ|uniref:flagellar biosynthesis protein FliQ n=1 Tax=Scandinavium sp. TaxID=2830653 RepID=UPI002E32F995|nr:flagellar biosynthesis protein FliQ [Scandinavium sp.]HEX4499805.1 flagellar biosynthesis protein FliQ [Scandinavium sp.]
MMNMDIAGDIVAGAVRLILIVSAVVIVPSLMVGLCVSIFQAVTQINEQTLSFLPRLVVSLGVLVFGGKWILTQLVDFTINIFHQAATLVS